MVAVDPGWTPGPVGGAVGGGELGGGGMFGGSGVTGWVGSDG
jgi:hypothetical protein